MEDNFNIHLGKKLRMRRLSLGLTQTKVAQAINVTFQQIQKYEKGTNGVSSNRLMQLSQFLKVPIIYFFQDYKEFKDINSNEVTNDDLNYSFLSRTFSSLSKIQNNQFFGGHAQNRTGIKGFAILCVTIPPRGHNLIYLNHLLILIKRNLTI